VAGSENRSGHRQHLESGTPAQDQLYRETYADNAVREGHRTWRPRSRNRKGVPKCSEGGATGIVPDFRGLPRAGYTSVMFNPIGVQRRGFSGRPLVALLFAVGMGIAEYYVDCWLHLRELMSFALIAATFGIVAYLWYRAERPR
jgi:Flp pilus assembly protein TadB